MKLFIPIRWQIQKSKSPHLYMKTIRGGPRMMRKDWGEMVLKDNFQRKVKSWPSCRCKNEYMFKIWFYSLIKEGTDRYCNWFERLWKDTFKDQEYWNENANGTKLFFFFQGEWGGGESIEPLPHREAFACLSVTNAIQVVKQLKDNDG